MAKNILDSEIVFRDLKGAYESLLATKDSPVAVRRGLKEFVILSQQLTEVFRSEFKQLCGKSWVAANFGGWNEVTELFKRLRRSDYHEFPFLVSVRQKRYMALNQICLTLARTWLSNSNGNQTPEIPSLMTFPAHP